MQKKLLPKAKEGILLLNTEPDSSDPVIEFWNLRRLLGTALRNGHHLTWYPPKGRVLGFLWKRKGYHAKPWVLYYYSLKPAFNGVTYLP